jgi:magnesium-transporting ATPase (P-type)
MRKSIEKINFKKLNKWLNIINLIYVIIATISIIVLWIKSPSEIPIHYGFTGHVDSYGSKNNSLILVFFLIAIYLIFMFISKYPKSYNYIVPINDLNRERQYNISSTFMKILSLELMILISYMSIKSLIGAKSITNYFLVIIVASVGIYIYFSVKNK